jgi:hypothetical protein
MKPYCGIECYIAIEFYIAVADKPSPSGQVFPAVELMKMADNITLFWDDAHQALIYRGPLPADLISSASRPAKAYWCVSNSSIHYSRVIRILT